MTSPSRSGVFSANPNQRVQEFTESISFDARLYSHDISASIAHAEMLAAQGYLEADELGKIIAALREIEQEISAGQMAFRSELEDIHMHIETALVERLGDLGKKIHTGRSRNDQVSTDLRLWVRDAIDEISQALREIQLAFVNRAEQDLDVILPAYTHLQRAQPVLAPHYWLAYCEKFQRDLDRLADCRRRTNISPLGTAAVAGSSLAIDRQTPAEKLGFEGVSANSLDASSDRDFVLEFAFALTVVATHLSNLAEEWILWSTLEFGFLKLPEEFCTGSSIMPQKINPDVLELIRGKSARAIGHLHALLTLTKGLPLAYNRDLQEDKPAIFDLFDNVAASCQLLPSMIQNMELQRDAIAARIEEGYLDATTMMEHFIKQGLPQRRAHHLVGKIVRRAMTDGVPLCQLELSSFTELGAEVDESIYDILGTRNAVQAFQSQGSSAAALVRQQVAAWQARLRPLRK